MDIKPLIQFLTTLEPDTEHEFYWSGLHSDGKTRTQAYGTLEALLPDLQRRNAQGYGIFICINAITPSHEGGYARRKASQVNRVRAVFADFDDPNKPIPELPLEPSLVVRTSPGKYHVYWLVDGLPLEKFEAVQRGIAQKLGSDPSVIDLSREMRVPGFDHTKGERHPVELLECHPGRRYSAQEVTEAFPWDGKKTKVAFVDAEHVPYAGEVSRKTALTMAVIAAHHPRRGDGGYNIRCPWASEHTTPDSASCSTYWPPTASHPRGIYICQHAHCRAIRMVEELENWISQQTATFLA
jgi:RepB DNA-primase from phage plasmid